MTRPKENAAREHRIEMEAVVDAYGEMERAVGWYYYLEGKIKPPFPIRKQQRPSPIGNTGSRVGINSDRRQNS